MRVRYLSRPGQLARITSVIGDAEGLIGAIDIVGVDHGHTTRDITFSAGNVAHAQRIIKHMASAEGVEVLKTSDRTFLLHLGGKIEVNSKVPVKTRDDLSMAYTPGVARICLAIRDDPDAAFALTIRRNTVAVVSDGSAVLGLGNIGAKAAMPVMEGKALLFKEFGGVDAFPICLDTQAVSEIVETCVRLAPTFGGINLEDISSPRCVEVEEKLTPLVDIPVFHDDQHGTAVVVLAALKNALKVVGKALGGIRVAISGAGAAGIAISRVLGSVGVDDIVVCDRNGAIWQGREGPTNRGKQWVAENTNPRRITGSLGDALVATDVFIGVSAPNVVTPDELKRMANDPIVFAMANPDPEIAPEDALPHVAVMATGRSDYPNQINNVLCFPGVFKGLLDVRARRVTDEMKIAAADAIADVLSDAEVTSDHIIPSVFDRRVVKAVSEAVSKSAIETRVARRPHMPGGLIASHDDTQ